jgi:ADP-heptose:LPS heptosyltransferase
MDQPSREILEFYGITDFPSEILRYEAVFADRFRGKVLSDDELAVCLRDGFFIGERKSHIGDYLTYSNIPRLLKTAYPGCRVFIAPHRLAESVFRGNPHVDAIRDFPGREPIGAFREFGWGNTHQRRARIFRISPIEEPVPELRIEPEDRSIAEEWKRSRPGGKKILIIHSSGRTVGHLLGYFAWRKIFERTKDLFHWAQIRFAGDQNVPCHERITGLTGINQTLAYLSTADLFLGPNSGPMHLHASLRRPGIILHNEITTEEIAFPILADNLCLPRSVNHHFQHCYSHHTHVCLPGKRSTNSGKPFIRGLRYTPDLLIDTIRSFA